MLACSLARPSGIAPVSHARIPVFRPLPHSTVARFPRLSGDGNLDFDAGLDVDDDLLDDLGGGVEATKKEGRGVGSANAPFFAPSVLSCKAEMGWDGMGWGEKENSLDETLVDAHLEEIPGLGTLTVGGLAGVDLEVLGGQTDGALDAEVLVK